MGIETEPRKKRLLIETQSPYEPSEKEREYQSRLDDLFSRLGGRGSCVVYRIKDGKRVYRGSFQVDENLATNFEEVLSRTYGGGNYWCNFRDGRTEMGGIQVCIDESIKADLTEEQKKE